MAGLSPMSTMMSQPDPTEMDQPDSGDQTDQPSTVELPLSDFGDVKEGQMLSLKVVSVDDENGVINAVPVTEAKASAGGSDSMAESLKEQPE